MEVIKRYKKYFLLVSVILIYSIIGFTVKKSLSNEDKINIDDSEILLDTKDQKQNFEPVLDFNYRNPFSKNHKNFENSNAEPTLNFKSKTTTTNVAKIKQEENKPLHHECPTIKLLAVITNSNSNICVLSINEKEEIVKESDIVSDVKIIKIFKDSVIIGFNKQIKTYKL